MAREIKFNLIEEKPQWLECPFCDKLIRIKPRLKILKGE